MTDYIRRFSCPILEGGWEEITGHGLTLVEGQIYVYRGGSWGVANNLGYNRVQTIPAVATDLGTGLKLYTLPYARIIGRGLSQWRVCHNTLLFYSSSGSFTREVIESRVEAVVHKQAEKWAGGNGIYLGYDSVLEEYVYRRFTSGLEWAVLVGYAAQASTVEEDVRVLLFRRVKLPSELYGRALPAMLTVVEFPVSLENTSYGGYTNYLEKMEVPAVPSFDGLDHYYVRYPWLWVSCSMLRGSERIPALIQPFSVVDGDAPNVGLGDMIVSYIPAVPFAIPWPTYSQVQEVSTHIPGSLNLQKTRRTGIESALGPGRLASRFATGEYSFPIHGEANQIYLQNLPYVSISQPLAYGMPVFGVRSAEARTFTVVHSATTLFDADCPAGRTFWLDITVVGQDVYRSPAIEGPDPDDPGYSYFNHEVIIPEANYNKLKPGQMGSITATPKRLDLASTFHDPFSSCPDFERVGPPIYNDDCEEWYGDACECVHNVNGTCPHRYIVSSLAGVPDSGIIDATFPTEDGSPSCWWSYQEYGPGGSVCAAVEPDWAEFTYFACYECSTDTWIQEDWFSTEEECLAADCDSYYYLCYDPDTTCECFCYPGGGGWYLDLELEVCEWFLVDLRPDYLVANIPDSGGALDLARQVLTAGRLPCPYDTVAISDKPETLAIPGKWLKEEDMATPIPTDPDTEEPFVYSSFKDLWIEDWAGLKISLDKEEGYILIETTAALDDLEPITGFYGDITNPYSSGQLRYAKAVAIDANGNFYGALSTRGTWQKVGRAFQLGATTKVFFREEYNKSILLRIAVGAVGPRGTFGEGWDTNRYYKLRQKLFYVDLSEDSHTIIDI